RLDQALGPQLGDPARRAAPGGLPPAAVLAIRHGERQRGQHDARAERDRQPDLPPGAAQTRLGTGMTAARLGMIDVEWRTGVDGELGESLERLLAEAASEDAEAGFPSFSLHDAVPEGTRYLLIWLLPDERTGRDEPPPTLAGCLRLEPSADDAGAAEVRLVIHPGLRSRGISTSLCEQVGLDIEPGGGWAGTGFSRLYCWARGDHPAAQRMSLRFARTGLRRSRREWRLLALLRRATDPAAAEAAATTDLATTDVAITRVGSGDRAGSAALEALWRDSGRSGPAPNARRVLITGRPGRRGLVRPHSGRADRVRAGRAAPRRTRAVWHARLRDGGPGPGGRRADGLIAGGGHDRHA